MSPSTFNHIRGGLYGQALGDAWGMPAYFRPHQTWARYGGWIEDLVDAPDDHPVHAGLKAGEITDDTEQALALAEALIRDGALTVRSAADAIVAWYERVGGDTSPYVGPSTKRAMNALQQGADPATTGRFGDTNGGAMRISAVSLAFAGDVDGAIAQAVVASTPSHFTDLGVSGTCAVAAAVAQALSSGTSLDDVIDAGRHGAHEGLKYGTPWLGPSIARKIELATSLARDADRSIQARIGDLYDLIGSTLMAADTVPCAFGVLALAEGDPLNAAKYAAALSGDADTVGAIACAIAGAWRGIEAIPQRFIDKLQSVNPDADFEQIATGLWKCAQER